MQKKAKAPIKKGASNERRKKDKQLNTNNKKLNRQIKDNNKKSSKQIKNDNKNLSKQIKENNKNLNYKKQEKRKKLKKIASILFVIILCITAITLFLLSPIFNITAISVKGNEQISSNEIISLSRIEKGTNLYKMRSKEIAENIKENKYIEEVKVSRKLPSTIVITVEERKPEFYIEFGGAYTFIDSQGYIIELSSNILEGKPKLIGYKTLEENIKPGNSLCNEDIENIHDVLNILNIAENYSIKEKITSINISDNSNYVLYIQNENKIVNVGTTEKLDTKMMYLQSILEKAKDSSGIIFLDVDFKNKFPYMRYN